MQEKTVASTVEIGRVDDLTKPSPDAQQQHEKRAHQVGTWGVSLLLALRGRNVYSGTVSGSESDHRRARNKAARRSRRVNRGGK